MSHAHVLIVDDDPALLQALPQAINLRMQHVDVDVSDSADKALQLVQQQSYDAIVSDIKMPGMDGIELIERLQIFCPDTPTLLITGHGEHTLAVQALRVGAYDFIQKPIDREYFVTALRRAIQIYQLRRRIADQQKALEQHADELEQAVEERTRDLVEANAAKDVFLSMASHELKTPLTTIKGLSQMLYRLVEQGEKIDLKSVELLANAARRMEILVNDILNTSLVDAAVFSLHLQAENLSALCHETLAAYSAEMGTSLRLEIVESDLPVNVDRERICQVLLNLLSNARKYSPPRSPVTIRVGLRDQQAVISVTDQGVGIPPEHLEHIFDRFYRSPEVDVQTGSSVGVGLGLYIARKIVEQHDGQISAISTPGKGSTFTIALPLLLPEGLQQTAKLSAEQS
jgi:two-component system, sensor histidine kinase and response regulator